MGFLVSSRRSSVLRQKLAEKMTKNKKKYLATKKFDTATNIDDLSPKQFEKNRTKGVLFNTE